MNGIASATQFAHSCSLNTFSLLVEASVGTNPGRHTQHRSQGGVYCEVDYPQGPPTLRTIYSVTEQQR